jgi:hypothetical protein
LAGSIPLPARERENDDPDPFQNAKLVLFMRWMLASTLALVLGISLADLLTCTVGQIPIFNPIACSPPWL